MRLTKILLLILPALLFVAAGAPAKESLVVKDLTSQRGVDKQTAGALSVIIRSVLGEHYAVQSLDVLATVNHLVEEKLKAGCDDTKCIMDVAGALDIGRVVTGDISKFGSLYTLSLQLISTRGTDLGVIQRASEDCRCSEEELVDFSRRVALKLIGKEPKVVSAPPPVRQAPAPATTTAPRTPPASTPTGERFTNSIGQEFVYIKPGTFMMGSPANEPGKFDDERQHRVTLTKGYYMQTTEVTQGQWQVIMGSNLSKYSNCGENCPVEQVSWGDSQEFIYKLNAKESTNRYRLPTEAEWEYAARAGTTGTFAGDLDNMGWHDKNSGYKTHPVAQKSPNPWGLYDMHGNIYEWCQDWYAKDYPMGSVTDPTGPSSGLYRVSRGGSWFSSANHCRSANRGCGRPGPRNPDLGFRLVATK